MNPRLPVLGAVVAAVLVILALSTLQGSEDVEGISVPTAGSEGVLAEDPGLVAIDPRGRVAGAPNRVPSATPISAATGRQSERVDPLEPSASESPEVVDAVPFEGWVTVPREWEIDSFTLLIQEEWPNRQLVTGLGSNGLERVTGTDTTWRFATRTKAPEVRLHVLPMNHTSTFVVPSGGTTNADVTVPPPGWLEVRLFDRATNLPVRAAVVGYATDPRPFEKMHAGLRSAFAYDTSVPLDPVLGGYRFRVPEGTIYLRTRSADHDPQTFELNSVACTTVAHDVYLTPSFGVDLVFRVAGDDETGVGGLGAMRHLRAEGPGEVTRRQYGVRSTRVFLSKPGRYVLSVPELAGYEDVPRQRIDVPYGRFVEHVVELTCVN